MSEIFELLLIRLKYSETKAVAWGAPSGLILPRLPKWVVQALFCAFCNCPPQHLGGTLFLLMSAITVPVSLDSNGKRLEKEKYYSIVLFSCIYFSLIIHFYPYFYSNVKINSNNIKILNIYLFVDCVDKILQDI